MFQTTEIYLREVVSSAVQFRKKYFDSIHLPESIFLIRFNDFSLIKSLKLSIVTYCFRLRTVCLLFNVHCLYNLYLITKRRCADPEILMTVPIFAKIDDDNWVNRNNDFLPKRIESIRELDSTFQS